MPQLLPFYFVNMLSYSFLLFVVILYVLSTYLLPKYKLLFAIRMSLVNTPLLFLLFLFGIYLFLEIKQSEGLLSIFVPIMVYHNADKDKSKILKDNKGNTGIYLWTHVESGKIYIGSAVDLYTRLRNYYNFLYLKEGNYYISRALLQYTHSAFSLSIIDYIDINGLSKEEARKLILSREQFYLDFIFSEDSPNTYNILKVAGSSLGYKHTEEAKALISLIHTGKSLSDEAKALISEANKGVNNAMFGKSHTEEAKALMSEAKSGVNHPLFGKSPSVETRTLISEAKKGKTHSAETKEKISTTKGSPIFVYDTQGSLAYTFSSARKAAIFFDSNFNTILKYARNDKLFRDKWKLSTSLITKD